MKLVILEPDLDAAQRLVTGLKNVDPELSVVTILRTMEEAVLFFRTNREKVSLVFAAVIPDEGNESSTYYDKAFWPPTVFLLRNEEQWMKALHHKGFDYLRLPFKEKEIEAVLEKYRRLKNHFLDLAEWTALLKEMDGPRKKRFIVKKGTENIALPLEDVALIYTAQKLTFILDRQGKKYSYNKTLGEVEQEVDNNAFFRINRQYIVAASAVTGFSSYERVKLSVEVNIPGFSEPLLVTQETAPYFRKWIEG